MVKLKSWLYCISSKIRKMIDYGLNVWSSSGSGLR